VTLKRLLSFILVVYDVLMALLFVVPPKLPFHSYPAHHRGRLARNVQTVRRAPCFLLNRIVPFSIFGNIASIRSSFRDLCFTFFTRVLAGYPSPISRCFNVSTKNSCAACASAAIMSGCQCFNLFNDYYFAM
jgi:hypothetical protein